MLALVITVQVIVSIFIVLIVLLQPGNRGGIGAALGGGGGCWRARNGEFWSPIAFNAEGGLGGI